MLAVGLLIPGHSFANVHFIDNPDPIGLVFAGFATYVLILAVAFLWLSIRTENHVLRNR